MRELLGWSFVCLFAGFTLVFAEPAWAQQQGGKVLVTASLISDVNSIQPGQKFRIGVLYRIEPGWHIYWKNPGDAGIPTKIAWRLPEGFTVHDLQWPIPSRAKEPGDLEVFAYSSQVLLFAEVETPQSLPTGPIEIQAKSDWLVCENFCIPGSAQFSLRMNTGVNTPSQSAPIFEKYAAQLPQTLPVTLRIGFGRLGKSLGLTVAGAPNGSVLDFFPLAPTGAVIGHVARNGNQLSIPIETEPKPLNRLDGVLVVGSGDNRHGYQIGARSPIATAQIGSLAQTVTFLGILQALGLAMIGGLILNVMPCVLPVISLKIFGFVSESGEHPDKAFRLSTAFSFGILACFAALAVIVVLLQAAGMQVGWGFQFQDYRFIVLISCLVFAFALNLFGVYELSVSAQATGRLTKLASGQGYGGAFFQGVFATILATPCTAPFLGTASSPARAIRDLARAIITLAIRWRIGSSLSRNTVSMPARCGRLRTRTGAYGCTRVLRRNFSHSSIRGRRWTSPSPNRRIRPLGKTSPAQPITNMQILPEATWSRMLFSPGHKSHCCRANNSFYPAREDRP
jgi:thiol:disulfide interchange protein DsbD